MEHLDIVNFNSWAKKHITDDSKFDEDGFIIMENNNNYKSTGTIAKIFEDHWDNYYSKYKVTIDKTRPNANKKVNKIISCSNHKLGATVYCCQDCGEVIFSYHTLVRANYVFLVVLKLKKLELKIFLKNV